MAERGATLYSLELLPRTTRAQAMDVLSSQANISGYKAVLMAAGALPKVFPLLTTAAGTLSPARVLVIGAGVAGLSAIATARRLGAVVEAYDVRDRGQGGGPEPGRPLRRARPRHRPGRRGLGCLRHEMSDETIRSSRS